VVVADVEDRDLLDRTRVRDQVREDLAAGVLRAGDAKEERERRGQIDHPDAGHGGLLADPRAGGHERRVHVHVVGDVDQVRQVAVLAEELAVGDRRSDRRRIELVGRPEHDNDVARSVRMEAVVAVDVPEVLLLEHSRDNLLARVGRVSQVLERGDDLVANGLVLVGRHLRSVGARAGGRVRAVIQD
jgi:hypothetical protein